MRYKLIALTVGGLHNKIFTRKTFDGTLTIVTDADFPPGFARKLVRSGHIEKIDGEESDFTIGVVIPTKGDRPLFLAKAKSMIARQTMQPQYVKIVDNPTDIEGIDIALRYEIGFRYLFKKGCDVVICWEDDDWYSDKYIATVIAAWDKAGCPAIFGVGQSTYYHIVVKKHFSLQHTKRASMMATIVTPRVMKDKFDYADPYLDIALWINNSGKTFIPKEPICLGIKHGFTDVGGGGHQKHWKRYKLEDNNSAKLLNIVGQDVHFYRTMTDRSNYEITKKSYGDAPVVSIITRMHGDNRPAGFSKNQEGISELKGDFEQIFIKDIKGLGLLAANSSFQLAMSHVKGKWVYLLDDDDYMVDPDIIAELSDIEADVVFVRAWIDVKGGHIFPQENVWEKSPVAGSIGGGCFFVKKAIFDKFIHHFAHERMGDFQFINKVFESGAKCVWLDRLVVKTFNVSRGSVE